MAIPRPLAASMRAPPPRPREAPLDDAPPRASRRAVQALLLPGDAPAYLRFVIPRPGEEVVLTVALADGEGGPTDAELTIAASTVEPHPASSWDASTASWQWDAAGCTPQTCHMATELPGAGDAHLTIRDSACSSSCPLHISVYATRAANVTVAASTGTQAVQLPLGSSHFSRVSAGAITPYAVLLDPESAADDEFTLQLHLCSGRADLVAGFGSAPTMDMLSAFPCDAAMRSCPPTLPPITLRAAVAAGRSKLFAGVHGLEDNSTFFVEARRRGALPVEMTISGDEGAVAWVDEGRKLTFTAPLVDRAPVDAH